MKFLFADDYAVYQGKVTNRRSVQHQGATLICSLDGVFDLDFGDRWVNRVRTAFVPSLVKHKFIGNNYNHVFLMFDPDHALAILLNRNFTYNSNAALIELHHEIPAVFATTSFAEATQRTILQLQTILGQSLGLVIDHRVVNVVEHIKQNLESRISMQELCVVANLSESRLAHLFREQVGMPIRKYVLWQRMKRAFATAQTGSNLTDAALDGGFADAAHFSRTVSAMFAASPSEILNNS